MGNRINAVLASVCVTLLVLLVIVVVTSDSGQPSQTGAPGDEQPIDPNESGDGSAEPIEHTQPAGPNFEIAALQPGELPPQFIIFSFDGAGSVEKWTTFMAAAAEVDAQFTGFLTGTYLVTDAAKQHYQGPGHAPGKSSVGFGGAPEDVAAKVAVLNEAKLAGHEIGTHYNGHFCAGAEPSGKDWTTEQWTDELAQFFGFLQTYQQIGSVPGPELTVTAEDIKGGRTPCLEGTSAVFFPASIAHGMTYDSSLVSNGMIWPQQLDGMWEFYMPMARVPATGKSVIAMDYNFWYQFNQAKDEPTKAAELTELVLDTYRSMLQAAQAGNRAPLVIGNHFNSWSGNAFNPAVEQFMLEACGLEGVVCTTYQNVLAWMSVQPPEILQPLLDAPPTHN